MTVSPPPRALLNTATFFISVASALPAYFLSAFLADLAGVHSVDILFAVASAASLVLLPRFVAVMEGVGRGRATFFAFVGYVVGLLGMAAPFPTPVRIAAFLLFHVAAVGALVGMNVLVEKYSSNAITGRIRGLYLTALNLGWVVTPFFAGRIMVVLGFSGVALIAAVATVPALLILGWRFFGRGVGVASREVDLWDAIGRVRCCRSLQYALAVAVMLQIFYAIMVIETPLVLRSLGFTPTSIGIMFTIMLVPFVVLQYPLGKLSDRVGEKEILLFGFAVSAVSVGAIAWLMSSPFATSFALWTALLFLSRIGAASIEVMRDSYFFKHVDGRDLHVIALLWSAMPIAYLLAPLVSTMLLRSSGNYLAVFTTLGTALLATAITLTRMPDTR